MVSLKLDFFHLPPKIIGVKRKSADGSSHKQKAKGQNADVPTTSTATFPPPARSKDNSQRYLVLIL